MPTLALAAQPAPTTIKSRRIVSVTSLLGASVVLCALGLLAPKPAVAQNNLPERQAYALQLYQALVGEMAAYQGDVNSAYRFLMEAANNSGDTRLYERAVAVAVESGSGPLAWQAASTWGKTQPDSIEAQRAILRVALAIGREQGITSSLTNILRLSPEPSRLELIRATPATLQRLPPNSDVDAERVLTVALAPFANKPTTAAAVKAAIGFVQLSANNTQKALQSARQAFEADEADTEGARLALALVEQGITAGEPLLLAHLHRNPQSTRVRFGYARSLYNDHRTSEALAQVQRVVSDEPDYTPAWLLLGRLRLETNALQQAQDVGLRALNLSKKETPPGAQITQTQALYLLSDIALAKQEWQAAADWLDQADSPDNANTVLYKRAVLQGKRGYIAQGYALLDNMAQDSEQALRLKLMTKAQWLREFEQFAKAYNVLTELNNRFPNDADLLYEQAMMADKLGKSADMERLLRQVMTVQPDHHHAYNALGYSFADKGERLPEAKALIEKALGFAPNDPYIIDSLGWVYFRLGELGKAQDVLRKAYGIKADGEIAAHLGEVLWADNQREAAIALWREALTRHKDNETLRNTMLRFGIAP
ncbi:tetratricopeptide repeat protein [Comamonadaceae bacterium M7527]|nr:tetratricopeptide repeat protein [Comamonadaceae bacterium M7527]